MALVARASESVGIGLDYVTAPTCKGAAQVVRSTALMKICTIARFILAKKFVSIMPMLKACWTCVYFARAFISTAEWCVCVIAFDAGANEIL
jgi:hypothetical protein